tara:strand:- start:923 stop:1141 length:219 start_codon:yes stop_codon:yes gene_type:complete
MKLKKSKEAEEIHRLNCDQILKLQEKFLHKDTSPEEKEKIRKIFEKIVAYADKQTDSVLFDILKDCNPNGLK